MRNTKQKNKLNTRQSFKNKSITKLFRNRIRYMSTNFYISLENKQTNKQTNKHKKQKKFNLPNIDESGS